MINRNSKNKELREDEKTSAVLKLGAVVVVDKVETFNPEFVTLYLAQEVKGLGGFNSVSNAQAKLLGWGSSTRIERAVVNSAAKEAKNINPGDNLNDLLNEDISLQVVDSNEPNFDGHKHRQDANGKALVNRENGEKVYRHAELVATKDLVDKITRCVLESKYTGAKATRKKILETQS